MRKLRLRSRMMSKKQHTKKKVTVKVNSGQAVYVADLSRLEHIISLYEYMAESCDDHGEKQDWLDVSQDIRNWITETYFSPEDNYEEEW